MERSWTWHAWQSSPGEPGASARRSAGALQERGLHRRRQLRRQRGEGAAPSPKRPASRPTAGTSATTRPASPAARRWPRKSVRSTCVVNNAGITRDGTLAQDELRRLARGDADQPRRLLQHGQGDFPGMSERGWGRIVNIGSINGQAGPVRPGQLRRRQERHPRLHQGAGAGRRQVRGDRQRHRAGLHRHRHGRRGARRRCSRRSSPRSRSAGSAKPRRSRAGLRS